MAAKVGRPERGGVIERVMFFALGFLAAGLIAVVAASALWRRAVRITTRRIEATLPMTAAEIEAEKDRLRAEFAVAARRLELRVESLRERAAHQAEEIAALRRKAQIAYLERDQLAEFAGELEGRDRSLIENLRSRDQVLAGAHARAGEAEALLQARTDELRAVQARLEEMRETVRALKSEISQRDARIDALEEDIARLRTERSTGLVRLAEAETRLDEEEMAHQEARRRIEVLERRLAERGTSMPADAAALAVSHLDEISRLAEAHAAATARIARLEVEAGEAEEARASLEGELKALRAAKGEGMGDNLDEAVGALEAANVELRKELERAAAERDALRQELAAAQRSLRSSRGAHTRQLNRLREQLSELAAQVVDLTARLEGAGSPIDQILAEAEKAGEAGETTLAGRIRRLREHAPETA